MTDKVTIRDPAETDIWHGAVLPMDLAVEIGRAVGSQAVYGSVAHIVVSTESSSTSGFTVADPDRLEEMAATLYAAAFKLREAREGLDDVVAFLDDDESADG